MKSEEIIERGRAIAASPILVPNPEKYEAIEQEYRKKTAGSEKLFEEAKKVIPRGSQHTLPIPAPYPLFMDKGQGSHVFDVDGNEYIDYILSGGANLLGHNHESFNENVLGLVQSRTNFHGFFDEMEIEASKKIIEHFPSIEKVRFTSSGVEAISAAIRIARAHTGKKKIIKFRGGYHGWIDQVMTDMEIPGSGRFLSQGIPDEILDLVVLVYQNDLNELEEAFKKNEDKGGIAAILCEPFGGESGLVPFEDNFHQEAIKLAHKYGALYIFDEVVTGLRTGLGGAQKILGVTPDLTTLGKALMNGYPSCGAVCGKSEIMETLSTGLPDGRPYTYMAGTLSANTLSVSAAYFNILELEKPGVMENLFSVAEDYVKGLNEMFESKGSQFFAYNFGGIIRIELTAPHALDISTPEAMIDVVKRRSIIVDYALVLHNEGILSRMGRDMISCSHTVEDNKKAVEAYAKLIDILE